MAATAVQANVITVCDEATTTDQTVRLTAFSDVTPNEDDGISHSTSRQSTNKYNGDSYNGPSWAEMARAILQFRLRLPIEEVCLTVVLTVLSLGRHVYSHSR